MQIIKDRRALHQIPELELELPKTMAYLKNSLQSLNCQVFSPARSSLCAFFDFGADHALAFRADCDALPVWEKNDAPYVSTHPGQMHACGHDGHMAILLELARRLNQKKTLSHNILLVFQPGEEGLGGARYICDSGVFEKYHVRAIFGLHLWPGLEEGKIHTRAGAMMSRASEITVDVYGKSVHIARAQEGIDALAGGVAFYRGCIAHAEKLPKETFRVLNFGHMQSGTVRNALSAHTRLEGTMRAYDDETFRYLQSGLYEIAAQVEKETGCKVSVHCSDGYPAVTNDPTLVEKVEEAVPFLHLEAPATPSEDFSFYQKRMAGVFFFLGLGGKPALHSDNFNFNEEILGKGADFFQELAEKLL